MWRLSFTKINIIPFDNSYRNEAILYKNSIHHHTSHIYQLGTVCILHYG